MQPFAGESNTWAAPKQAQFMVGAKGRGTVHSPNITLVLEVPSFPPSHSSTMHACGRTHRGGEARGEKKCATRA